MAFQIQRSRSTHSMRNMHRPMSRASTTSAASPAPELLPQEMQQHYMTTGAEATLMQQFTGAQNPGVVHAVPMDSAMMGQHMVSQQLQAGLDQYHARPYSSHDAQFILPGDSQDYGRMSMPFQPSMSVPPTSETDDRRRKNSAATATNDKELRELLHKNENRVLKDVAQEVIQKERTPQAEKTKQLFAMLWLRKVCKPAKTSVPRNRVYSKYATRCGTERVVPLNPASFGKLVRVIFPGIQTRRLGVRGESKYHYVDLALDDDEDDTQTPVWPATAANAPGVTGGEQVPEFKRSASAGASIDFGSVPKLSADVAAFPCSEFSFREQPVAVEEVHGPPSKGRLFAYPDTRGMIRDNDGSLMYNQILRFPTKNETDLEGDDTIALPSIYAYCPPKTDRDTAEALVALYRTHCTSLVDCIRFCKEKQFFRLFTSFHGTLTVPVQKLFGHPNLAPWIQECDYLMYQKMVRFVSRLTLQAAPPIVITILNNISTNLHAHISKTFHTHAAHVLEAKLQPAAVFASLLHRLIRVNAAAHAAANLLTIDQNREQMWREWVTMVNPKRVMEGSLPDCGYEEVYKVLTVDIRGLLEPLHSPPFPDNPMFECDNQAYVRAQTQTSQSMQPAPEKLTDHNGSVSTENVLDRWSTFLMGLPARFPQADTRTLLACISSVGTGALRDITIMGGASYQTWWVMKIFVDEMTLWLAAMGGFLNRTPLDHKSPTSVPRQSPLAQSEVLKGGNSTRSASATTSRPESIDADFQSTHDQSQSMQESNRASKTSRPQSKQSITEFDQVYASFTAMDQNEDVSLMPSDHHVQAPSFHEFDQSMTSGDMSQPTHRSGHKQRTKQAFQASMRQEIDVDDSGIGMSMTDDELTLARYGLSDLPTHASHDLGINVI